MKCDHNICKCSEVCQHPERIEVHLKPSKATVAHINQHLDGIPHSHGVKK